MMKKVMAKAWEIADIQSKLKGGKKSEWIGFGLKRAWVLFKEGKLVVEKQVSEVKKSLNGGMTSKQNWFIDKLMNELDNMGIDPLQIDGVRDVLQDGIYGTTKSFASQVIENLLSAKKAA